MNDSLPEDCPVRVTISSRWCVNENDERVTDTATLAALDGYQDESGSLSDYLDGELSNLLYGGTLSFSHEPGELQLSALLDFVGTRPLTPGELDQLCGWTRGQHSDGFGESLFVRLPSDAAREVQLWPTGEVQYAQRSDPDVDRSHFLTEAVLALFEAARENDIARVQELLDQGARPDVPSRYGVTALEFAASAEVLRHLLDRNPSKASMDKALVSAAHRGNPEHVDLLLSRGVSPNVQQPSTESPLPSHGQTALTKAACNGQGEMVTRLLDAGADINGKTDEGKTALHWADDTEIVRLLLERGADPSIRDASGQTPRECHAQVLQWERESTCTREEQVAKLEAILALLDR